MTAVSVIIPTYNRAQLVSRAVGSVLQQTFADHEIIVVDDGSRDHTPRALRPFGNGIRYLAHEANRGVSAARNTGIRASTGELIAFLDSDDYWFARKLETQTAYLSEHPQVGACQTEEIWIRCGRRVNPALRHRKPSGDIFRPSLERCLVSPSAVMLRRSVFEEVGLFDEDLPACEDYDLWLRVACRHAVDLLPRPLVVKEGGRQDQLSARYAGMDRFRIRALCKLLGRETLNPAQREAALRVLAAKCRIYALGCSKRGRPIEGAFYRALPERLSLKTL